MNKYTELAADIIDLVCERMAEEYDLEPKMRKDDSGEIVEEPAFLFGKDYYLLEDEIAQMIKDLDKNYKAEQMAELEDEEEHRDEREEPLPYEDLD